MTTRTGPEELYLPDKCLGCDCAIDAGEALCDDCFSKFDGLTGEEIAMMRYEESVCVAMEERNAA